MTCRGMATALLAASAAGPDPGICQSGRCTRSGDGAGTRIAIRVVEDDDGMLTGQEVPDSWRDPPFEGVWLAIYRRLERPYPGEIPLPPQA